MGTRVEIERKLRGKGEKEMLIQRKGLFMSVCFLVACGSEICHGAAAAPAAVAIGDPDDDTEVSAGVYTIGGAAVTVEEGDECTWRATWNTRGKAKGVRIGNGATRGQLLRVVEGRNVGIPAAVGPSYHGVDLENPNFDAAMAGCIVKVPAVVCKDKAAAVAHFEKVVTEGFRGKDGWGGHFIDRNKSVERYATEGNLWKARCAVLWQGIRDLRNVLNGTRTGMLTMSLADKTRDEILFQNAVANLGDYSDEGSPDEGDKGGDAEPPAGFEFGVEDQ
jgi:hypothetical protein